MKTLLNKDKILQYSPYREFFEVFDYGVGVKTIDEFVKRTIHLAPIIATNLCSGQSKESIEEKLECIKGDMLEILSELFFNEFESDPAIGLREYTPVPLSEDYGVDAIGVNVNNDTCAVQDKFRANPYELIDLASISRTYASGQLVQKLPLKNDNTIYLFTTSEGITVPCKTVFGNKIRIINRSIIAGKIDNNHTFWKNVEGRMYSTLK